MLDQFVSTTIKQHLPLVLSLGAFVIPAYIAYQFRANIHLPAWIKISRNLEDQS